MTRIVNLSSSRGDTSLRALIEALAYCAIIEANTDEISAEAVETYGLDVASGRRSLVVMGRERYWSTWPSDPLASVYELSDRVAETLDMHIWFVDLGDVDVMMGSAGSKPQMLGTTAHTMLHTSHHG